MKSSGIRLSESQKEIVEHREGALLVVAGPGSGKTRVLTERVRRLLSSGSGHFRVLALTFTNKAANEMKERLDEFPDIEVRAYIGTLHSFCTDVLASRGASVGISEQPHIFESFDDRTRIMADAADTDPDLRSSLAQCGSSKEQGRMLASWLDMVDSAKNELQTAEMLPDGVGRRIYETYDRQLRNSNAVDFNDLLLLTYQLFLDRPKIADFYRRQYRFICIDEAQDLNRAQYELLKALCGETHRNVMMVGDPKQAIYVWNGANPEYMNMFEREFSAKRYELKENFRSSRAVVSAARSLFPTYSVVGQLPIAGEIRLLEAQDPRDEAYRVIEYLKRLMASGHEDIEGEITLDKCALLARNRYVFQEVEKLLVHEHLPFYKRLSAQHESESYLIRDFENALRVLANPRDQLHLGMLATRWDVPIDRAMEQNKSDGMQTVRCLATASGNAEAKACLEAIAGMEWSPGGFRFAKALDLLAAYASQIASPEERSLVVEDLGVWRRHWNVFLRTQQQGTQNLAFFLSSVAMGATQQMRQEGLALLTVHSAKGLEFDVVVVMGMTEETFPDYRAMRSSGGLEEESRNAFVAVTRSRRLLAFSYPKRRVMPWGDDTAQKPSRYLEVMGFFTDPGGRS